MIIAQLVLIMSQFYQLFHSGTTQAGYTVNQNLKAQKDELEQVADEHAGVSFFLLSAKQNLDKAIKKLLNLIMGSTEKEEEEDVSEKDIALFREEVDYWENELCLAAEEYVSADFKLKSLRCEASRDEFEEKFVETAMLETNFDNAWERIGERLKWNIKACGIFQAKRLEKTEQEKRKLVDELEASRDVNERCKLRIEYLEAKYEEINDEIESITEGIENLREKQEEMNGEFEIIMEEKSKLVDELEASRGENESYKMQIEDVEEKYRKINGELDIIIEEKSKLVDELEASRGENESYKMQIEDLKERHEEINHELDIIIEERSMLVDELEASRDENESYMMQIKDLKEKHGEVNDAFQIITEEKSMLVAELEASRDKNESYKMQIKDLETKYEDINDELEIIIEEKSKLVDELEASRDENGSYKMQIKDLETKYKEIHNELEIIVEEKSELIDELEASRDEVVQHEKDLRILMKKARHAKKALASTQAENESYKMLNKELEMTMNVERSNFADELEAARVEVEKGKKALEKLTLAFHEVSSAAREAKEALFTTRLENESYKNRIDDLAITMKEERSKLVNEVEFLTSTLREVSSKAREASDDYKMQIEDLKEKNEKNESMLNDFVLGDWKIVEEEGQQ